MFWSGIILYVMILYLPTSVSLYNQVISTMRAGNIVVAAVVVFITIWSYVFIAYNKSRLRDSGF